MSAGVRECHLGVEESGRGYRRRRHDDRRVRGLNGWGRLRWEGYSEGVRAGVSSGV